MNYKLKKFLIVVVVVLIIFFGYKYIKASYISKRNNADTYLIGKDSVASIKSVVGVRSIVHVSSSLEKGITKKEYVYNVDKSITDDVSKYIDKLKSDGFLTVIKADLSQSAGTAKLGKTSAEEGKVLFVEIKYNTEGYTITLLSGTGTIAKSGN